MPEQPAWPSYFSSPEAVRAWLTAQSKHHKGDQVVQRHLLTLRWLLLSELDRTAPGPSPRADYLPESQSESQLMAS